MASLLRLCDGQGQGAKRFFSAAGRRLRYVGVVPIQVDSRAEAAARGRIPLHRSQFVLPDPCHRTRLAAREELSILLRLTGAGSQSSTMSVLGANLIHEFLGEGSGRSGPSRLLEPRTKLGYRKR